MKNKIIILILAIALISLWRIPEVATPLTPPSSPIITIGETRIKVEVADTLESRTQGLSDRPSLAEDPGLLFIFDTVGQPGFWMKDMHFPIDIIWLDENWKIVDVTLNATPENYPEIYLPRSPIRYVLEVNSGFISAHNPKIGDHARFTK